MKRKLFKLLILLISLFIIYKLIFFVINFNYWRLNKITYSINKSISKNLNVFLADAKPSTKLILIGSDTLYIKESYFESKWTSTNFINELGKINNNDYQLIIRFKESNLNFYKTYETLSIYYEDLYTDSKFRIPKKIEPNTVLGNVNVFPLRFQHSIILNIKKDIMIKHDTFYLPIIKILNKNKDSIKVIDNIKFTLDPTPQTQL